jgi:DNA replication and repair protein RecF
MRNSLLKNQPADTASLQAFEQILAESGAAIVAERQSVIAGLSTNMLALLTEIKGGSPVFSLKYNFHPATLDPALYLAKFADYRAKETARGYTLFGPHLDDFDFILEDKDLRHYGSTGQCRLAALCLKMAAVNLIAEKTGSSSGVIALVDDATGELDESTRAAFFKVLENTEQSFFTFTEKPQDAFFRDAGTFRVENGCLTG